MILYFQAGIYIVKYVSLLSEENAAISFHYHGGNYTELKKAERQSK